VCGKEVMVPFQPDGKRPIYCADHLKEQQARPKFLTSAASVEIGSTPVVRAERGEAPLPIKKPVSVIPIIKSPVPISKPQIAQPPRVIVHEKILERHDDRKQPIVKPAEVKKVVAPIASGASAVHEGQPKEQKFLSLKDLKPRAPAKEMDEDESEPHSVAEGVAHKALSKTEPRVHAKPDMVGLRAALNAIPKADVAPRSDQIRPTADTVPKSNILKPGQTIKF
jgi:CxxC-x17-CxxC domain-containing protein